MAKKKSTIRQKVGPIEAKRLGADVAQYKRRTSAKQWKALVADAHKRGRTIRSELFESGMPEALRERTKTSLKAEAEKNIAAAYTPAVAELDSQESRAKALSAKRAQDNIAYRSWMDQQAAAQAAQAAGAQQRYATYLAQQQAQVAQPGQLQGQAQAAAQAAPNTVSDMSQSTAIKGLSADEQHSQAQVANARAQTAAMIPSTTAQQQNLGLATRGTFEAAETKRLGDQNKDLTDVFDARQKLQTSRAADAIKEYTRLLDNETAKAQSNRDYGAAAEKLGLDSFKAQQQASKDAADIKIKTDANRIASQKARDAKRTADAKLQLGYDQLRAQKGKAAADRALKKWLHDHPAAASKGTSAGDKTAERKATVTVSNALGDLTGYHQRFPRGKSAQGKTFRQLMRAKGYDNLTIDVAEDLRKHGGKLSARGRLKARQIGILHPEKTYGVA